MEFSFEQAFVGIAFSIGFVVGPMIGALFAWSSSDNREGTWYVLPALFALFLSLSDLIFVAYYLKESLPLKHRATTLVKGLSGAVSYINPIDLFQFNGVSGLSQQGILFLTYTARINYMRKLEDINL